MQKATSYEIHVQDCLDEKWAARFIPFAVTVGDKESILIGVVHDQAELFGVLLKIRDLGLSLVSVNPVERR